MYSTRKNKVYWHYDIIVIGAIVMSSDLYHSSIAILHPNILVISMKCTVWHNDYRNDYLALCISVSGSTCWIAAKISNFVSCKHAEG